MGFLDKIKKKDEKTEKEDNSLKLDNIKNDNELLNIINENSDKNMSLEATGKIKDEKILKKIVCGNYQWIIRKKALENIEDSEIITDILNNTNEDYLKKQIITTKTIDESILEDIGLEDHNSSVRIAAIEKINNNEILYDIIKREYKEIKENNGENISIKAIENITDTEILKTIAKNESCKHLSTLAILKITDDEFLKNIVKTHSNEAVRIAAIGKISDEETLKDIAKNDKNCRVRKAAIDKIHTKSFLVKNMD